MDPNEYVESNKKYRDLMEQAKYIKSDDFDGIS